MRGTKNRITFRP